MATQLHEWQLEVGDVYEARGQTYEVLAFSAKRRSRTERRLPDGKPYKIAPSSWANVVVTNRPREQRVAS